MAYPEGMILCMSRYVSLEFHALLCFLGNHSTVVVENQALKCLMSLPDPTGRLARWTLTLQGYDFGIRYRPRKDHGNADALSRRVYTISQQPMFPQISTVIALMLRIAMTSSNNPLSNI